MNAHARSVIEANVPRYTSYPTAPHFHAGVGEAEVRSWLAELASGERLSLYLHIPFCDKLCWFCACHTKHTQRYEPVAAFLEALKAEIGMIAALLPMGVLVDAIHFGGGSPTLLRPQDFLSIISDLKTNMPVHASTLLSVEIDPSDMDSGKLDALAEAGLGRASLGVQDFDPKVQQAINRLQSFALTKTVVDGLRARGVPSINLDLLYGLPHQTVESLSRTVHQALELRPDRIALFGYAHVPWFKKHQTMIEDAWLPGPEARLAQSQAAADLIAAAGYSAIGIDHFALPDDSLAQAAAKGELRRNFQGYTDDSCETLIGLGPSSVSRYRQGYAQNIAATGAYETRVRAGQFATARGLALSPEDQATAWLIERLMCDFAFKTNDLVACHGKAGQQLIKRARLVAGESHSGLMEVAEGFEIAPSHRLLARTVAARFDAYLAKGSARHSAAV